MRLIDANGLKGITASESAIFGILMELENEHIDIDEATNMILDIVEKDVKEEIENAPTVDAESVTRCKDCVYFNGDGHWCDLDSFVESTDYCSGAERKDE